MKVVVTQVVILNQAVTAVAIKKIPDPVIENKVVYKIQIAQAAVKKTEGFDVIDCAIGYEHVLPRVQDESIPGILEMVKITV